jgi:hypothetical protein
MLNATPVPQEKKGGFGLWGFRFLLWYLCILLVQPQNRFTFLWPLRIANLSFIIAVGLHLLSCVQQSRPVIRMGIGTIMAFLLLFFALISQYMGVYQVSSAWNPWIDLVVKNALLLIMVEAMCTSIERVWALQMVALCGTLWWVKSGLRLAQVSATFSGDRMMGAAVSLIENPNSFAYMMCVFLPLYLYAYQQARNKWAKCFFVGCALCAVYIIFKTGSRTGLVTLVALFVFLLPHYGRHHIKTLALIILVAVAIFPFTGEKNIERFRTIPRSIASFFGKADPLQGPLNQDEQSAEDRRLKNIHTWQLIKEHPLLGVGMRPNPLRYVERFPMALGQVHCEILMAGRQMGFLGMGLYVGFIALIYFGGGWIRRNARYWPAVGNLGWTFQMQAIAIAVGGSFCPLPWHAPMMMLAGSVSVLIGLVKQENIQRSGLYATGTR